MMTQIEGGGQLAAGEKTFICGTKIFFLIKISFVAQTEFNFFADSILRFPCINQHIQSNRLLAANGD